MQTSDALVQLIDLAVAAEELGAEVLTSVTDSSPRGVGL